MCSAKSVRQFSFRQKNIKKAIVKKCRKIMVTNFHAEGVHVLSFSKDPLFPLSSISLVNPMSLRSRNKPQQNPTTSTRAPAVTPSIISVTLRLNVPPPFSPIRNNFWKVCLQSACSDDFPGRWIKLSFVLASFFALCYKFPERKSLLSLPTFALCWGRWKDCSFCVHIDAWKSVYFYFSWEVHTAPPFLPHVSYIFSRYL